MVLISCTTIVEVTSTPNPSPEVSPTSTVAATTPSTFTPTIAPVPTEVPTQVPTPTSIPTPTPEPTPTQTPRPSPTPINTPVPTSTPVPTPTSTPQPTSTPIPTPTSTPIPTPIAGTVINDVILNSNTTWRLSDSPFHVQGTIQIPANVTLTIEPGVTIFVPSKGRFESAFVYSGEIRAVGTPSNPIIFSGSGSGILFEAVVNATGNKLFLQHTKINEFGALIKWGYQVTLYDSVLEDVGQSQSVIQGEFIAERNIFKSWGGMRANNSPLIFNFNCFSGIAPSLYHSYTHSTIPSRLNNNSIYGVQAGSGPTLIMTENPASKVDIDATNNYWHDLSEDDVRTFIVDGTTDIKIPVVVNILPFSSNPHPGTPDCSIP